MQNNVRVITPCGNVIGEATPYGAAFRGIRYGVAKRFEKPSEITEWQGDYSALEFGACCPQARAYSDESKLKNTFYYKEFRESLSFTYSEDCLFLNIYVPKEAKDCPVILYFHGGGFTRGSADEKPFDGEEYAKRGVIFVAVNYRLNIFGFFADGKNCKGNLGLYDQLCAINWIKHNIAAFGGNPNSVILMGQSAGAMSGCDLVSSPVLDGKIKGAIMLSGGGIRRILLPKRKPNTKFWNSVVKSSGAKDFEQFKKLPAKQVFEAWQRGSMLSSLFATAPVIDNELVFAGGENKHGVPCIIGSLKKDMVPSELRAMARRYARKLNKQGKPCYVFKFIHNLPGDDKGTFHSADLWYAIGAMKNSWRPFAKHDFELSHEMIDRFVAFAKTCNPNIDGAKQWSKYSSKKDTLIFE